MADQSVVSVLTIEDSTRQTVNIKLTDSIGVATTAPVAERAINIQVVDSVGVSTTAPVTDIFAQVHVIERVETSATLELNHKFIYLVDSLGVETSYSIKQDIITPDRRKVPGGVIAVRPSHTGPLPSELSHQVTYKGIALPTNFKKYPHMKFEKDLVRDSVITILLTKKGQRLFVPDFGSDLWKLVFEPNDIVSRALAEQYVKEALGRWEPRVRVTRVSVNSEEHTMLIIVSFLILRLELVADLPLQLSKENYQLSVLEAA
jgi:phage baseplate assembly protein W